MTFSNSVKESLMDFTNIEANIEANIEDEDDKSVGVLAQTVALVDDVVGNTIPFVPNAAR